MKRNLDKLSKTDYDLIVIGGGINGACVAWDATLRGLSTALLEKHDFGAATSSNSLKIIHGGLRYLQHADLKRMRESIRERKIFMQIAPHLVHPLPVLLPTYGHLLKGKEMMAVALLLNDLISFDRNQLVDPGKYIPQGKIISKEACLDLLPGVNRNGLTGAALWYDSQAVNTERLNLSFLLSASKAGADIANYTEVLGFLRNGNNVNGVKVKDVLTNEEFDIKAKIIVNSSGPWITKVNNFLSCSKGNGNLGLAKAINLVTRQFIPDYAFGISGKNRVINSKKSSKNESRFFFITPWRNYSLIGTNYEYYSGDPDDLQITENDIQCFIEQVNSIYSAAELERKDVYFYHVGLVPISNKNIENGNLNLTKHYHIYDHKKIDGIDGLISLLGVKYTTARDVAQKTIDLVYRKLRMISPKSISHETPIYGGQIQNFNEYLQNEKMKPLNGLSTEIIEHLIYNYGSEYKQNLKYIDKNNTFGRTILGTSQYLKAEVVHAVREEMALKLSDVVFRRIELGTGGHPGNDCLKDCASIMAQELQWDNNRIQEEIQETQTVYLCHDK